MRLDDVLKNRTEKPGEPSESERGAAPAHTGPTMDHQALDDPDTGSADVNAAGVKSRHVADPMPMPTESPAVPAALGGLAPSSLKLGFDSLEWHVQSPDYQSHNLWKEMPTVNRVLAALGCACLAVAVTRTAGPVAISEVYQTAHPFTTAGRQETCMSNLQRIGTALAMYTKDADGKGPPLDYESERDGRVTWVSALTKYGDNGMFSCPSGPGIPSGDRGVVGNYGLNPVLANRVMSDASVNPAGLLAVADRAQLHDVSLLPPVPSWQSSEAISKSVVPGRSSNIDFRHDNQADVLFGDGHVESRGSNAAFGTPDIWGGSLALVIAKDRLNARYPVLAYAVTAVSTNKQARSRIAAELKWLEHSSQARTAFASAAALWRLNIGANHSPEVDGWAKVIGAAAIQGKSILAPQPADLVTFQKMAKGPENPTPQVPQDLGTTAPTAGDRDSIMARYDQWRLAWEREDLTAYLGFYAPNAVIVPADGEQYGVATLRERRARQFQVERNVHITDLTTPALTMSGDRGFLIVTKKYDSTVSHYQGLKRMVWVKWNGTWVILQETFSQSGQ